MPKEWVEVADTAIKIGLSSIVTGTFAYVCMRYSHKSDKLKFMLEHKVILVEKAEEDIDIYLTSLDDYIAQIKGITKKRKLNNDEKSELTKNSTNAIRDKGKHLLKKRANLKSAVWKLRLLKAKHSMDEITKCNDIETEIRNFIIFEKKIPTYDWILSIEDKYHEAKVKFQESLSDYFFSLNY